MKSRDKLTPGHDGLWRVCQHLLHQSPLPRLQRQHILECESRESVSADAQDILQRPETPAGSSSSDGMEDLTDLISELVVRQAPKRKQFSIPLRFAGRDGDIEIGVAG